MTNLNLLKPSDIARRVTDLPEIHAGTLRIFGHWFGRPYDNQHEPVGARGLDTVLLIVFRGGERLSLWEPEGVHISAGEFTVEKASRVLWQWYYYGREPVPENLRELDYQIVDNQGLSLSETGSARRSLALDAGVRAVELCAPED